MLLTLLLCSADASPTSLSVYDREGKFHVLPEEPDSTHQAGSRQRASAGHLQSLLLPEAANSSSARYPGDLAREFTESELNTLKAQLEALLPVGSWLPLLDGTLDDSSGQWGRQ